MRPLPWHGRLVREGRLGELAVCIVDELHMLCDPSRGVALELSITKLLHSEAAHDVRVRSGRLRRVCLRV